MLRKMGLSSLFAFANASSPQGYHSTGFRAYCKRYGLFSLMSRLGFLVPCIFSRFEPNPRFKGECFLETTLGYQLWIRGTSPFFGRPSVRRSSASVQRLRHLGLSQKVQRST